jgi:hypothetical protein
MVCKSIFWNIYLQLLINMEVLLNNWCFFQVNDFSFLTLISFHFLCFLYTCVDLRSCFAQKYRKLIQVKIFCWTCKAYSFLKRRFSVFVYFLSVTYPNTNNT